jgi:hypothetical protein
VSGDPNARATWASAALDLARSEGRCDEAVTEEDARVACVVFDNLAAEGLLPPEFSRVSLLCIHTADEPRWLTREDYAQLPGWSPCDTADGES